MALIDVGMVNAERHYFMVNQEETKGDYRFCYREKLCSQLFDTNWSLYEGMTNNEVLVAINPVEDDDSSTDVEEGNEYRGLTNSCIPLLVNKYITANASNEDIEEAKSKKAKSYKGVCCQVCVFEGRKFRTKSVAYCNNHGIRACLITPNVGSYVNAQFQNAVENSTEQELSKWRCPYVNDSCWKKAHSFYIERGLWKKPSTSRRKSHDVISQVNAVKLSSILYQNKEDWMLKHHPISRKGAKPGRKSRKRPTTATTMEAAESTTKRRHRNKASTTTNADAPTTNDDDTSGVMAETVNKQGSETTDSDSKDDSYLNEVTQRVNV